MSKVSVLGAGSWGIALAKLLCNNGNDVTVWSALSDEIEMLEANYEHIDKLPGVKLPKEMKFTCNLKEAVEGKDVLVMAVPSPFVASTAKQSTHSLASSTARATQSAVSTSLATMSRQSRQVSSDM